jgi:hypothetical protein
MSVNVHTVEQQDPRLGRQMVHDSRSLQFPASFAVDPATWRTKSIRVYEPLPNPNQEVGCCTGVSKCTMFNAVGNRKTGSVLDMDDALSVYSLATTLDPWDGAFPPVDTGSSGLAAAKAAQQLGLGGQYRWLFGGADEIVQAVMGGICVSVGTWWYNDMFDRDVDGRVQPTGAQAGGHQWTVRGYDKGKDWILGRCWWGDFRDFWIARADLDELLHDGGDAHIQERV